MNETVYKSYDQLPAVLTAKELAKLLRISRSGAYSLITKEGFPALKLGKRIIVPKDLFIKWLEKEATKQQHHRKL